MTALRRRWPFSLRTLFAVVTVLACWLGWELNVVRQRQAMRAWISEQNGRAVSCSKGVERFFPSTMRTFPKYRRLFGDAPVILISFDGIVSESDFEYVQTVFPEAIVKSDMAANLPEQ